MASSKPFAPFSLQDDIGPLWISVIGFFMGFGFGVGCALAVMYSIYTGGYRKAMEDSLREESLNVICNSYRRCERSS